ncbi:MAG: PEP-CTERM sorting domain-containing protein [Pirellulales bacterium]|nr:PEP-CTERM sorting domain-containing protein [Pirellulales bacterium]
MTSFVDRFLAILAVCAVLLSVNRASAVEKVYTDFDRFGVRGSISDSIAAVGQRFGGPSGNGDVQVFDPIEVDGVSVYLADILATQEVTLSTGADFGAGALAVDGNTIIAAAYRNEVNGATEAGCVFVFTREEGEWTYQDQWNEPLPLGADTSIAANAKFGIAGDLDGNQALVLAGGKNMAYVYNRLDGVWDGGTPLPGGSLNSPVAGALDNGVVVVGSLLDAAHADVWRYNGETWGHEAEIAQPVANSLFGSAVAISGDTLVVAAHGQAVGDQAGAGAVHLYQYDEVGSQWLLEQSIENPDPVAGDAFGYSVAIEGDRLVVGAPRVDVGGAVDAGAAYVFERDDSVWTQIDKQVLATPLAGQWFGETVGVDEFSLLIGGSGKTTVDPVGQGVVQLEAPVSVRIPGDANRSGAVDDTDAAILAAHWGDSDVSWGDGDFDGDNLVGPRDASILAAHWGYGSTGTAAATAVPEPSTLVLLIGALLGLAALRR